MTITDNGLQGHSPHEAPVAASELVKLATADCSIRAAGGSGSRILAGTQLDLLCHPSFSSAAAKDERLPSHTQRFDRQGLLALQRYSPLRMESRTASPKSPFRCSDSACRNVCGRSSQ